MNVLKNEINQGVSTICLAVEADEFNRALESAYLDNTEKYHISGYLAGLAPREKIEEIYGKTALYNEALELCTVEKYGDFIKEQGLRTIGQPQVEEVIWPEEGGVTFTITCELYPEVSLGEYKGISTTFNKEEGEEAFAYDVLSKARDNMDVEIPSRFMEQRFAAVVTQEKEVVCEYLSSKQKDLPKENLFETYLEAAGLTKEQWLLDRKAQVYQMARLELLLDAIVEKEDLNVTINELEMEYYFLSEQNGIEVDDAFARYDYDIVKKELLREKARLFILDHAVTV